MTTVLQVLALWIVLSGVAAAGVCLLITGARVSHHRKQVRQASEQPHGRRRAADEEHALSA